MKYSLAFGCALLAFATVTPAAEIAGKSQALTDGRTFKDWEGDTNKTWRIEGGAFVGGSLEQTVARNEFLATTRPYTNFVLRLKFKLTGKTGFINGGVQVRSQRIKNPPNEMSGYQADIGEGWTGALYDESRRNKVLVKPDPKVIDRIWKRNEWNDYEVRCEGKHIRLAINGERTIDYTEPDDAIEQWGLIGLQIHGGATAEASYKDIIITELP